MRADTRIRAREGNELAVTRLGFGLPIVVLPGGPAFHGSLYRDLLEPLGDNYGVVFWDYRGCGKSSSASRYSIASDLEDLRSLHQRLSLQRPFLLGHSYGAMLALQYVLEYPGELGGLILVAPISTSEEFQRAQLRRKARMSEAEYENWKKLGALCAEERANRDQEVKYLTIEARNQLYHSGLISKFVSRLEIRFPVLAAMQKDLAQFDVRSRLGEIQTPTLIVAGQHDVIAGEEPRRIHESIAGSHYVSFGESGHYPFFEQQARFLVEINDWMKQRGNDT